MDDFTYNYTGNQLSLLQTGNGTKQCVYDANGNCIVDGLNGLNLQYNFLNLVGKVESPDTNDQLATYKWLADGTKLGVTDANGKGFDYVGSLIYKRDGGDLALESTSFGGGRINKTSNTYEVSYFITDHLGSVRATVNQNGERTSTNNYYAFGLKWNDPDALASTNRWLYNGKELQTAGLPDMADYLDYGARMYLPRLGRWQNIDILSEKYYPISPYVITLNNPIRYIDLDGMDVWELDEYGNIINYYEDKTQDTFYMVAKDADGNYQRTYTFDKEGNKVYNSVSFEYGTISHEERSFTNRGVSGNYDIYGVKGDENGKSLFEFMSNNITGSPTAVEIGHIMAGNKDEDGLNYVTTSHTERAEYGQADLVRYVRNHNIRELNHSHPSSPKPSGDLFSGDYGFATDVVTRILPRGTPKPKFQIYHVPTKKYISFHSY